MTPLRVLVLNQHYWPETAATAQILTDLCEDLAAMGHEVHVLCGAPSYQGSRPSTAAARREVHNGVAIQRVPSYRPRVRTIPHRLLHYLSYFASSLIAALSAVRPDVCFVMSTPPLLLGVTGTILAGTRRVPFVYSVQDLYPDVAIHLGVLPESGPLTSTIDLASRVLYRAASRVVTLSAPMAERLAAKGVARDRIAVIPNWADTTAIRPVSRINDFAKQHGFADSFVVQYSGNLGRSQGLEAVVRAACLVQDLPVRFALVGAGDALPMIRRQVAELGLSNVSFLEPQPREHLDKLLGSCDVGLVTMRRGVARDLVPSKLYGIMAASRPVLASVEADSEVGRVLREQRCGWIVEPEDPRALAAEVRRLFESDRSLLESAGERGAAACRRLFERRVLTERYGAVLVAAARTYETS